MMDLRKNKDLQHLAGPHGLRCRVWAIVYRPWWKLENGLYSDWVYAVVNFAALAIVLFIAVSACIGLYELVRAIVRWLHG